MNDSFNNSLNNIENLGASGVNQYKTNYNVVLKLLNDSSNIEDFLKNVNILNSIAGEVAGDIFYELLSADEDSEITHTDIDQFLQIVFYKLNIPNDNIEKLTTIITKLFFCSSHPQSTNNTKTNNYDEFKIIVENMISRSMQKASSERDVYLKQSKLLNEQEADIKKYLEYEDILNKYITGENLEESKAGGYKENNHTKIHEDSVVNKTNQRKQTYDRMSIEQKTEQHMQSDNPSDILHLFLLDDTATKEGFEQFIEYINTIILTNATQDITVPEEQIIAKRLFPEGVEISTNFNTIITNALQVYETGKIEKLEKSVIFSQNKISQDKKTPDEEKADVLTKYVNENNVKKSARFGNPNASFGGKSGKVRSVENINSLINNSRLNFSFNPNEFNKQKIITTLLGVANEDDVNANNIACCGLGQKLDLSSIKIKTENDKTQITFTNPSFILGSIEEENINKLGEQFGGALSSKTSQIIYDKDDVEHKLKKQYTITITKENNSFNNR